MLIMNGTDSDLLLVSFDPDTNTFEDITRLAPRDHIPISDIDAAQLEVHGENQFLILTPIAGAQGGLDIGNGGGGIIHDPGDGEPPFGA